MMQMLRNVATDSLMIVKWKRMECDFLLNCLCGIFSCCTFAAANEGDLDSECGNTLGWIDLDCLQPPK